MYDITDTHAILKASNHITTRTVNHPEQAVLDSKYDEL